MEVILDLPSVRSDDIGELGKPCARHCGEFYLPIFVFPVLRVLVFYLSIA